MLNIFFVSNDSRVEKLIEYYQSFFKTKIRRASDFDQGLKEIFENRPGLVFIQSTIGAVSGEIVARHVKSLLGPASPLIVVISDETVKKIKSVTWCDDWLHISDSEEGFQDDFAELMARRYPHEWMEIERETGVTSPSAQRATGGTGRFSASGSSPAGSVDGGESEFSFDQNAGDDGHGGGLIHRPGLGEGHMPAVDQTLDDMSAADQGRYCASILRNDTLSPDRKRTGNVLKFLIPLLVLAAVVAGLFYRLHHMNPDLRSTNAVKVAPPPPRDTRLAPAEPAGTSARKGLPSFIDRKWRDVPFSASNPGWERYVSSRFDFRVFREHGMVKAFQVYSPENAAIPDNLISSMLREFGYSGLLPRGDAVTKDGYVIETGKIEGFAEFESCRDRGTGRVRAFVLVFS